MTTATASLLSLELPNPESDNPIPDFENIINCAWGKADQASLVSDVVKGRVLRTVRDREKKAGPNSKGQGFCYWLKSNGIGRTLAYDLIDLANAADRLIESGAIAVEHLERFTKKAFVQMAKSSKEIQGLVCQRAASGEAVGKEEIKDINDQQVVCTSDLLPDEIKGKATAGSIPSRYLAPLVREMEKLPETIAASMQAEMGDNFDASAAKQAAKEAKNINLFLEKSPEVAILEGLDIERTLDEALRIGNTGDATSIVKLAQKTIDAAAKLYTYRDKLGKLSERIYTDTGASTPHLRKLLCAIDPLVRDTMRVPVSQDKTIFFKISEENFSTSESPAPNPTFPDPHLEKAPHVWAQYLQYCEKEGLDTKNIAAAVSRLLGERHELTNALNIIEGRDREIEAQRSAIVAKQSELDQALAEREGLLAQIAEMKARLAPVEALIETVTPAPAELIAPIEATEPAKPQAIATKAPTPEPKAIALTEIIAGEILKLGGDSLENIKLDKTTAIVNDSATSILEISHDSAMGMAIIKFNLGNGTTVTRIQLDAPLQIAPDAIALVPVKTPTNSWRIDTVKLATGDRVEGSPQYTLEKAWSAAEVKSQAKPTATAKKQRKDKYAALKDNEYNAYENQEEIAKVVKAIVSVKSEEEVIKIPLSEPCYLAPKNPLLDSKDVTVEELVINGQVTWKVQGEASEFELKELLFDRPEVGDRVLSKIVSYAATNAKA